MQSKLTIACKALLLFGIAFGGFLVGRTDSPLLEQHPDLILTLSGVASEIMNCAYFRASNRSAHHRLWKRLKKPFYFAYDGPAPKSYLAHVNPPFEIIWLSLGYFMVSNEEQKQALAHELLTLSGLSSDVVDRTMAICYQIPDNR